MPPSITHFDEEQINLVYPDGIEKNYWHLARQYIAHRWIRSLPITNINCLDVGCGKGTTVAYLRAAGLNCYGCDLSPYRPYRGAEDFLFLGKALSEVPENVRLTINVVILLDVIEHLPEPKLIITEIKRSLPNVNFLLITVPARVELWTAFDDYYGHFRRYTLASFREFAAANSLQLIRSRYLFQLQYPVAFFLYRFVKRSRSLGIKPPAWNLPHELMALYFAAESRFMPGWVYGTSVMGLLKM